MDLVEKQHFIQQEVRKLKAGLERECHRLHELESLEIEKRYFGFTLGVKV